MGMNTYAAAKIEDFWRAGGSSGRDLVDAHRFENQDEAEQMAEILNGKLSGELAGA